MLRSLRYFSVPRAAKKSFRLISDENGKIRVRFAPSPTGSLHIGGARTAMYNWLYAMKMGGDFVIRVEDTDQVRSTRSSENAILQDLRWLGMKWSEGPDIGGPHSPYRQSERKEIYHNAAEKLIATGHAYRCFCEEEKLEVKRPDALNSGEEAKYDGRWRNADPAEIQANLDKKMPFTVRFKVPAGKKVTVDDKVFGPVSWDTDTCLDDFIIMRSNGMPVYNFCVAVDDIDMRITQVIRAQEHLTNTLKQLLIMEALGFKPPEYAHCSILLGSDGAKLSKRHGSSSVDQFKQEGYLPLAILSYLTAFRSTEDNSTRVVFSLDEIIERFGLSSISKGPAMFDIEKLQHFNREYLKAMTVEEIEPIVLKQLCSPTASAASILLEGPLVAYKSSPVVSKFLSAAVKIAQRDMVLTVDSSHLVGKCLHYPLEQTLASDPEEAALFGEASFLAVMRVLVRDFGVGGGGVMPSGTEEDFEERWKAYLKGVSKECKVKGKGLYHPVRLALTGCKSGPEVLDYVRLVGLSSDPEVTRIVNPDFAAVSMTQRMTILKKMLEKYV